MAQQTAVDWLREQYVHITWMVNRDELPTDTVFEFMLNRFEQAKQTEREQHGKTWLDSTTQFANDARMDSPINFDDYYNETYCK